MAERVINNQGVKILLERMESNPDEFVEQTPYADVPSKWANIIADISRRVEVMQKTPLPHINIITPLPFLSNDEVLELYEKLNSIRGDIFTKEVMARLLDDSRDRHEELSPPWGLSTIGKSKREAQEKAELARLIKEAYRDQQLAQQATNAAKITLKTRTME